LGVGLRTLSCKERKLLRSLQEIQLGCGAKERKKDT